MPSKAKLPFVGFNVRSSVQLMAGFEVATNGRFWVATEGSNGTRSRPDSHTQQEFSEVDAEGILGAIALSVFAISKYMERSKKRNSPDSG